jgi:hypothetical protein
MPEPDPYGIEIGPNYPGQISVLVYHSVAAAFYGGGNKRHRIQRAKRILSNLRCGGWCCIWCREPVLLSKRADAKFCSDGCRKRAARDRRA